MTRQICNKYPQLLTNSCFRSGPDKWRLGDDYTPSKILEKYCDDFGIKYDFDGKNESRLILTCGENCKYFNAAGTPIMK